MFNKEDNTISVLQKSIRHFKIPVTNKTIRESLKTHPNYPTFKSISDSLTSWNIEHYPLKVNTEEIKDINTPYIVHFNDNGGQLAFVTKTVNDHVHYYESYDIKKSLLYDEFLTKCSGAIILLSPDEKSGEDDFQIKEQNEKIKKAILPLVFGTVFIYILFCLGKVLLQNNITLELPLSFLFLTKALGLIFSTLLIFHEFDIHTSLSDKLCNIHKETDCNTVLNSSAAKIFGWFGWADLGFVYFLGGLLIISQYQISGLSLLAITSVISIPYPLYSIYYQGFVLKKWCPLCLAVQALLVTECLLLSNQFLELHFTIMQLLNFIFTFLFVTIAYILANLLYREVNENLISQVKYLRFKNDPDVFKNYLLKKQHYHISKTNHSLVFGHNNSSLTITAFLSLNCSHCARAFLKIKDLLRSNKNILVHLVLLATDAEIINTLYFLNKQNKEEESLKYLENWYNKYPYSKYSISENICDIDGNTIVNEVLNENIRLFDDCNINATPRFLINGFLLPEQYDISDISHFSEII